MDLNRKLEILSDAAKYDVSCSSSGSTRKNTKGGLGNSAESGICHSWSADGRCISLLKILLTNDCVYNCAYCVNRSSNDVPRAYFTPREIAELTMNFYRRNYIEGLFLSSAVIKNADHTMELMLLTAKLLRTQYRFNGYIHLKAIPGADSLLIEEAGKYADRMSVNIELPSSSGLKLLAPQKNKEAIISPMNLISKKIIEKADEKKQFKSSSLFVPAGQSTQLIVGATPDHDLKILKLSEGLYKRFDLKRVYYSAFVPVSKHPLLPVLDRPPLQREHRLYQADWLLRFYGFSADELLDDNNPNFSMELDPKTDWALRNIEQFPVEINKAELAVLLRVPGIGIRSAQRIVAARRICQLDFNHLKSFGIVMKRARYFITCKGRYFGISHMNQDFIKTSLLAAAPSGDVNSHRYEQLSIFSGLENSACISQGIPLLSTAVTGEL